MPCISTRNLIKPFIDAGLVPDNCRRIVFDFAADDVARILYETYADGDRIGSIMSALLESAAIPPPKAQALKAAEAEVVEAADEWASADVDNPDSGELLLDAIRKLGDAREAAESTEKGTPE